MKLSKIKQILDLASSLDLSNKCGSLKPLSKSEIQSGSVSKEEESLSDSEGELTLRDSEYDDIDPEEIMYQQYLQTGTMVKRPPLEMVINLERINKAEYRLKEQSCL